MICSTQISGNTGPANLDSTISSSERFGPLVQSLFHLKKHLMSFVSGLERPLKKNIGEDAVKITGVLEFAPSCTLCLAGV